MACQSDFDCPGTEVCYTNITWAIETGFADAAGCACSAYYGWHGPNCLELSAATYAAVVFNIAMSFIAFVGAWIGVSTLYELVKANRGASVLNASNTTSIFTTLSLLAFVGWRISEMLIFLAPSLANKELSAVSGSVASKTKYHEYSVTTRVFTTLAALFATLASLNISLMWIEVANSSSQIRRRISSNFSVYKITIYVFEALLTVIMVVFMALNETGLAALAVYPFIFFMIIVNTIGGIRMGRLLDSMASSSSESQSQTPSPAEPGPKSIIARIKAAVSSAGSSPARLTSDPAATESRTDESSSRRYREMLRLIQVTSRVTTFFLVLIILGGGLYGYMGADNWRKYTRDQQLSAIVWVNHILVVGIIGATCTVQWYCYRNMKTALSRLQGAATGSGSGLSSSPNSKDVSFSMATNMATSGHVTSFNAHASSFQGAARSFYETADVDPDGDLFV